MSSNFAIHETCAWSSWKLQDVCAMLTKESFKQDQLLTDDTAQLYCMSWLNKWVHSTVNTERKRVNEQVKFWNSIKKGMLENKEMERSFGVEQMGFDPFLPTAPFFLTCSLFRKLWMIKGIKRQSHWSSRKSGSNRGASCDGRK